MLPPCPGANCGLFGAEAGIITLFAALTAARAITMADTKPRGLRGWIGSTYSKWMTALIVLFLIPLVVLAMAELTLLVGRAIDSARQAAYDARVHPMKAEYEAARAKWEAKLQETLDEDAVSEFLDKEYGAGTYESLLKIQRTIDLCEYGIQLERDKQEVLRCRATASYRVYRSDKPECMASFQIEDALGARIVRQRLTEPFFKISRAHGGPFDDLRALEDGVRRQLEVAFAESNPPPDRAELDNVQHPTPWLWKLDWSTAGMLALALMIVHVGVILVTIPHRRRLRAGSAAGDGHAGTRSASSAPPRWFWVVIAVCVAVAVGFYGWNVWYDNIHPR